MSTNYIDQITDFSGTTHDIAESDSTRIFRATCSTAASTAAKVATLNTSSNKNFSLTTGVRVAITFQYGNSATTPTLRVDGTATGTAKSIACATAVATRTTGNGTTYNTWGPYETIIFTYDGTYWVHSGSSLGIYNAYALANSKSSFSGSYNDLSDKPTIPSEYTLPVAKYNTLGGVKPAYTSTNAATLGTTAASNTTTPTIQAKTTDSGRYYAVEADKNGVLFVNVPWLQTTNTDEKVSSSNSTNKLYLVGTTSQSTDGQSGYSNSAVYATNGNLTASKFNGLTLTNNTTGFAIAGGSTTSKILTVSESYTLGAACAKAVVTSVDTSASLPTANAVKTFVEGKGYITSDNMTKVQLIRW